MRLFDAADAKSNVPHTFKEGAVEHGFHDGSIRSQTRSIMVCRHRHGRQPLSTIVLWTIRLGICLDTCSACWCCFLFCGCWLLVVLDLQVGLACARGTQVCYILQLQTGSVRSHVADLVCAWESCPGPREECSGCARVQGIRMSNRRPLINL